MRCVLLGGALVALFWAYSRRASSVDGHLGAQIDGITFPSEIRVGSSLPLTFVGGGTRLKFNVVKVYAAALYLQDVRSNSALKTYRKLDGIALRKKGDFFRALVSGPFQKALLLSFHRSVSGSTVADALKESLSTRISRSTLAGFREVLLQVLGTDVPKGSELFFACRSDTLHLALGSPRSTTAFHDKTICGALFDVYLGASPISPAIKEGVADGFAEKMGK
uniref:Chalcone isomerase domain-containing protein n=1 Tax=Coccolithus braarudii TaxID=221442 RepID=A0A7S0LMM7_9EUKA|mmetsp:Transcript_48892/g.104380  ORF Transcript_48892/g.104380 Transcript_48892/m.104380 type:complete len:222 (+) Transcript_48892:36-701(+)